MSWEYTIFRGKKLKRGYTTGSCAAGAAKAAVKMLFSGEKLDKISILTPAGVLLELDLHNISRDGKRVSCSVKKFSGDDPDITDGIHVFASAEEKEEAVVEIAGGEGVGVVTRPGLQVPEGEIAINPVPMSMILGEVNKVLLPGKGVRVVISIPGGEELARKTFNPKLGIMGGLSILGTTGIVEPMSEEAFKETLALELKLLPVPEKQDCLVLVPGNIGKKLVRETFSLPAEKIFKMGNFVGFILDKCLEQGVQKVLLAGHIGKLFKVAAGIFHTHSHVADARFETFAAHASLLGADRETIRKLSCCATAEEMTAVLDIPGMEDFFNYLAARVSLRVEEYTGNQISAGTVLFSLKKGVLGMDSKAKMLLGE
ncbi:MAG: cobalamin biosynthesis protein CbiD [Dethiobacter sp.]|jgi:cobalt-precorrin-5B (C1)-methyltransferase|nr:MAG: cobalamin biosynthesis protein CbiD [Dethiobacter sp.]